MFGRNKTPDLNTKVLEAINQGKVEGLDARLNNQQTELKELAKIMHTYSQSFIDEGMSETMALKATILMINFEEWVNEGSITIQVNE